jgi:hypothetical protein
MISQVIIVSDEGLDLGLEIAWAGNKEYVRYGYTQGKTSWQKGFWHALVFSVNCTFCSAGYTRDFCICFLPSGQKLLLCAITRCISPMCYLASP